MARVEIYLTFAYFDGRDFFAQKVKDFEHFYEMCEKVEQRVINTIFE